MTKSPAIDFVENLCSAFPGRFIADETKKLYVGKLRRWNLTKAQWERALDLIIDARGENQRGLPELPEIYTHLKRAVQESMDFSNYGRAYFRLPDGSRTIRIKSEGGVWVISELGNHESLMKYAGEPVIDHIPENADDYYIAPDYPVKRELGEGPNLEEIRALISQTKENLGRRRENETRKVFEFPTIKG